MISIYLLLDFLVLLYQDKRTIRLFRENNAVTPKNDGVKEEKDRI